MFCCCNTLPLLYMYLYNNNNNNNNNFLKRMACRLSSRWDRSYAEVLGWIRARLAFAIVRASVLCVRGSCTKWRSLGLEDGAAIDLN